jgi:hypothetical protein
MLYQTDSQLAPMGQQTFKVNYIDYPNQHMLLFGVTQCNNVLLMSSIFINESSIGCSNNIKYMYFAW